MINEEALKNNFIHEAKELLESLETVLLDLENDMKDEAAIQEIFRIMHTLKGSAGMFGFNKISNLTHHIESIYDLVREGKLVINSEIISITLAASDVLSILLNNNDLLKVVQEVKYRELLDHVKGFFIEDGEQREKLKPENSEPVNEDNKESIFYIYFSPHKNIFKRGLNPYFIFDDLVNIKFNTYPPIKETPLDDSYKKDFTYKWEIYLSTSKPLSFIEDIFMFYNDNEYKVFELDPIDVLGNVKFAKLYKSIHNNKIDLNKIKSRIQNIQQTGLISGGDDEAPSKAADIVEGKIKQIDSTKIEDITEDDIVERHDRRTKTSVIKVPTEKLDELINLVSELVIINSQLTYLSGNIFNLKLKKTLSNVERLTKNLRDNALELRLVPIKSISLKLQRLVRDLSKKLDKKVDFVTEGADTELDSNIINKIESPLIHIIRNCMDHGIESIEERTKKGKTEKGIIRLIAFYSGAHVFIQVQDDGKGLDIEDIRKNAIDKGIINPTDKLTNKEIFDLIFLPGFSTAQNLSEISGRGVGMDVVKSNINDLRGIIEIDSEKDLGTSISLKLPLTLSIIDTLLVKIDNTPYLVPLSSIDSCHKIEHKHIVNSDNHQLNFKEELIPYIYLRDYFNNESTPPEVENFIILEYNEKKYAIVVDKVMGELQAVVKPLGHMHKDQEYLTGASVLGDGSLALIIDTNKMVGRIKEETLYK